MKIGIIGAGNIGGTLTRRLTKLGHEVAVANSRGPHTLQDLEAETGAKAVAARDTVTDADIVVVTIPMKNVPKLPKDVMRGAPRHTVVIDTNNYYPQQRDGRITEIEEGTTESRWVEQQIGHAVVKAFNCIRAQDLMDRGVPARTPGRIALPVAADDLEAKAIVMRLVGELGFGAVDAGGIDDSWRQQPGTPCYAKYFDTDGLRQALREASSERTDAWRAK